MHEFESHHANAAKQSHSSDSICAVTRIVIPGRAKREPGIHNPGIESSIHTSSQARMDSGLARRRAPRNDGLSVYALKYAICVVVASRRPFGDHNSPC